jgi:photosystem II stability/assembly factor-like uncharacterized protein
MKLIARSAPQLAGRRLRLASQCRSAAALLVAMAGAGLWIGVVTQAAGASPETHRSGLTEVDVPVQWKTASLPPGLRKFVPRGVSCKGSRCVAVGIFCPYGGCGGLIPSAILASSDGGSHWVLERLPAAVGTLSDVSCWSASDCVALGAAGLLGPNNSAAALLTRVGGELWSVVRIPGDGRGGSVTCALDGRCYAQVGTYVDVTTNGGETWTIERLPANTRTISSVFGNPGVVCPSASVCFSLVLHPQPGLNHGLPFETIMGTTDGGAKWTVESVPATDYTLSTISCPNTHTCVVGGSTDRSSAYAPLILVTTDAGKDWRRETLPVTIGSLRGSYCFDARRCFAVGTFRTTNSPTRGVPQILTTMDGGEKWTEVSAPAVWGQLQGVVCASAARCVAIGQEYSTSRGGSVTNTPLVLTS